MLNFTQQDALGNFLTVLSRHSNAFKQDVWELYADYNPHKDFSVSGSRYYDTLESIPEDIKDSILKRAISAFKYNECNPRETFSSFAYLKLCSSTGYVFMNLITNVIDKFKKDCEAHISYSTPKVPFLWMYSEEDSGFNGGTIHFSEEMNEEVFFQLYEDEIVMSVDKRLLHKDYYFDDYPSNETLQLMARDLLERDSIREIHCPWIYSQINYITAQNDRAFNRIDFTVARFSYQNNQGSFW